MKDSVHPAPESGDDGPGTPDLHAADERLCARLRPGLRALIKSQRGFRESVDDLVQECLLVISQRFRSGKLGDTRLQLTFAHTTAMYVLANARRSERNHQRVLETLQSQQTETLDPGIESQLIDGDRIDAVRSAVKELANARDREVLYRYYVDDEDKHVICAALNLEARHFDRVLHRARVRLREFVLRSTVSGETNAALATFSKKEDVE